MTLEKLIQRTEFGEGGPRLRFRCAWSLCREMKGNVDDFLIFGDSFKAAAKSWRMRADVQPTTPRQRLAVEKLLRSINPAEWQSILSRITK